MRFTIDARSFLQALKRLDVRRNRYPYVQIRAVDGQITLLSSTHPSNGASAPRMKVMQVHLSLPPATLAEEGTCAVHYRELVHAAKTLSGMLTVELREGALVVTGEGPRLCQMPIQLLQWKFPEAAFKEPTENECYTKERSTSVQCDTCKQWHYEKVMDTYRITQVIKQQLRINRDLLAAMCAQVAWAARPEDDYRQSQTGIRFELDNDVLSLIAFDDQCAVIRKQVLAGSGSWSRPILIPAARLTQALRLLPKGEEILIETIATQHQRIFFLPTNSGSEAVPVEGSEPFFEENSVSLSTESMCVTLSLIATTFPDYQSVFPSSPATRVSCPATELLRAVNATMPVDAEESHATRFTVDPTKMMVEAWRDQVEVPVQYEIPLDHNPDRREARTMLDAWYVRAFVASLMEISPAREVSLAFTGPLSPALLHAGGEQDEYLMSLAPTDK